MNGSCTRRFLAGGLLGLCLLPFGLQDAVAQIRIGDHRLGRHAPFDVAAFKRSVDVQDASLIPGAVSQSGLTVAARHYTHTGEDALFAVDLKEARVVAVQLTVSNHSGVKLLLGAGVHAQSLLPLNGVELFRRTERSTKGSGALLNVLSLGRGTTALRLDTEAANEAVAANFYRKSLREKVLQPGESVSGFVFFDSEALSKLNACLAVPFHSLDRLASLNIQVPVSGLENASCHDDGAVSVPQPRQRSDEPPTVAVGATDREPTSEGKLVAPPPSSASPVEPELPTAPIAPAAPPMRTDTLTLPNGDRYEGDLIGLVRTGKGRYFYANGGRYEGEFLNDAAHGKGVYFFVSGDRYKGEFHHGEQSGRGVYYYANGDRYEGEFQSGVQAGAGIHYYSDGDRYEGAFANGVRHGPGTFHFKSGESRSMVYDMGTEVKK